MAPLEYTPAIWPFVASLLVSAGLGVYAARRSHVAAASTFAWLMLALAFWTLCYLLELSSTTLAGKVFWASAKYPGSASSPVLWFVLSLQLTKHSSWLRSAVFRGVLWAFVIVTCLVVFTNSWHQWYWTDIRLVPGEPESIADHGFYFWIYAAGSYAMVLTSVVLFVRAYWATPHFYRQQAVLMALGGFIPLGGRILEDFLGLDLFPKVDNIILLLLCSGIFFAIAIFRYGALTILHIAHSLVIQNIEAGIIVLDTEGRVIEVNPYALERMGIAQAQLIGRTLQQALPAWPDLSTPTQEITITHAGGPAFFHVQSSQIRDTDQSVAGQAIVLFDITARKLAELRLEHMARTDPLTEIANRRHFFAMAQVELDRAQRYAHPIGVLLIDIDHFKQVNDRYGHQVGDTALQLVARECQRQLRTSDLLARYGGEELICLLVESSEEGVLATGDRIRRAIAAVQLQSAGHAVQLTVSIGVAARAALSDVPLDTLIARADQALYQAKAAGRNRVSLWVESRQIAG